jgi:hypothetical protein
VLKDALTKWITLIPAHTKEMYSVQKSYIEQWTSQFGAPEMLITDRGTEFHNMIAKQLAELWGVRKIATTSRNPRSNGQIENQMRTTKDMLQSYINDNQQDWDEYLPHVAQAYNNTVNSATGMTPYYLMFGTEMNMASEEHTESMDAVDFHELVRRTKEVQQGCWQYVGDRVVDNSNRHNVVPRERLAFKPYEAGDYFYLRVVPKRFYKSENEEQAYQISAKLQFRYTGPYMVSAVISPVLYESQIHGKVKRVHAINMKPASKRAGNKDTPQVVQKTRPVQVNGTSSTSSNKSSSEPMASEPIQEDSMGTQLETQELEPIVVNQTVENRFMREYREWLKTLTVEQQGIVLSMTKSSAK